MSKIPDFTGIAWKSEPAKKSRYGGNRQAATSARRSGGRFTLAEARDEQKQQR